MSIPKEIIKKIRHIEIHTKRLVNDLFGGEYHSTFKGQGMEFDEVREYQPGDDVRMIDWNVTARTGFPHIKRYKEERELTVMLVVDASSPGYFGTHRTARPWSGSNGAESVAQVAQRRPCAQSRDGKDVAAVVQPQLRHPDALPRPAPRAPMEAA